MDPDFYRDLAADYDRMIRWERRLAVERPQFDALFARFHVRSVLDAACGSGHHLALFASLGLDVEGADASGAMVALARETTRHAGFPMDDRIHCVAWSDLPSAIPRRFDAVLCIGNSLPYVMNPRAMADSVRGLWSRVAPGGILVLQYKNFEKLIASRERFLPLSWTRAADESAPPDKDEAAGKAGSPRETVAIRLYDYHPDHIGFNVILLDKSSGGDWSLRHHETPLRPYRPEEVEAAVRDAAAAEEDAAGVQGSAAANASAGRLGLSRPSDRSDPSDRLPDSRGAPAEAAEATAGKTVSPASTGGVVISRHGSLGLEPFDPAASGDVVILARRAP